jgi:hypothetical protein
MRDELLAMKFGRTINTEREPLTADQAQHIGVRILRDMGIESGKRDPFDGVRCGNPACPWCEDEGL